MGLLLSSTVTVMASTDERASHKLTTSYFFEHLEVIRKGGAGVPVLLRSELSDDCLVFYLSGGNMKKLPLQEGVDSVRARSVLGLVNRYVGIRDEEVLATTLQTIKDLLGGMVREPQVERSEMPTVFVGAQAGAATESDQGTEPIPLRRRVRFNSKKNVAYSQPLSYSGVLSQYETTEPLVVDEPEKEKLDYSLAEPLEDSMALVIGEMFKGNAPACAELTAFFRYLVKKELIHKPGLFLSWNIVKTEKIESVKEEAYERERVTVAFGDDQEPFSFNFVYLTTREIQQLFELLQQSSTSFYEELSTVLHVAQGE